MKKNKNIIGFIVVFIAILYKYLSFYELQSELVTKGIIIIAIIFNIIIILKRKFTQKQLFIALLIFMLILFMTYLSKSLDFIIVFYPVKNTMYYFIYIVPRVRYIFCSNT